MEKVAQNCLVIHILLENSKKECQNKLIFLVIVLHSNCEGWEDCTNLRFCQSGSKLTLVDIFTYHFTWWKLVDKNSIVLS